MEPALLRGEEPAIQIHICHESVRYLLMKMLGTCYEGDISSMKVHCI